LWLFLILCIHSTYWSVENLEKGNNAQGIHKCDWVPFGEVPKHSPGKLVSGSFRPKHVLKVPNMKFKLQKVKLIIHVMLYNFANSIVPSIKSMLHILFCFQQLNIHHSFIRKIWKQTTQYWICLTIISTDSY